MASSRPVPNWKDHEFLLYNNGRKHDPGRTGLGLIEGGAMAQMQPAEPTQNNLNHARGLHGMTISEKGMQVHATTPSSSSSFEGKGGSITSEYGGGLHDQGKAVNRGVLPQQDVGIGYNLNPSPSSGNCGGKSPFTPSTFFSTDAYGLGAPSSIASHPPPSSAMAMAMAMPLHNPTTLITDDHLHGQHHHHVPEISTTQGVQEKLREGLVIPLDAVEAPLEGCVHTTGDMYGHVVCVTSSPPPPCGDDSALNYAICNVSDSDDGNGEPCHEGVGERLKDTGKPCPSI